MAMAVRKVSWHWATPQDTAITSVATLFLESRGFFHRDFIKRVHGHLDVRDIDTALVRLDAYLDVVVNHALNGYQYLH
jgi:hypothetical protein